MGGGSLRVAGGWAGRLSVVNDGELGEEKLVGRVG